MYILLVTYRLSYTVRDTMLLSRPTERNSVAMLPIQYHTTCIVHLWYTETLEVSTPMALLLKESFETSTKKHTIPAYYHLNGLAMGIESPIDLSMIHR